MGSTTAAAEASSVVSITEVDRAYDYYSDSRMVKNAISINFINNAILTYRYLVSPVVSFLLDPRIVVI